MTASKGLRPALLFLASGASLTTASISARKLSKGTTALSVSSGSPLALIASRRLSRSKKPGCPTAFPRATDAGTHESDLRAAGQRYFSRYPDDGGGARRKQCWDDGMHQGCQARTQQLLSKPQRNASVSQVVLVH